MENSSLNALLAHSLIGVIIHDYDDFSIKYLNDAAATLLGCSKEELIGQPSLERQWHFVDNEGERLQPQDYPISCIKTSGNPIVNRVYGIKHDNQSTIWVLLNGYIETHETFGTLIVVVLNDITSSTSSFSFEKIVENTHDMIIVTEADNLDYPNGPKIIYVNKAFERITGYAASEAIGRTPRMLQGSDTCPKSTQKIHDALKHCQEVQTTVINYNKQNEPYWIEMNIIPLKNRHGKVTHFVALERDVSKQVAYLKQLEDSNKSLAQMKSHLEKLVDKRTRSLQKAKEALERIAFLDPLTDIPNRRFFFEQSEKLLQLAERHQLVITVGILDLDDFKSINDIHGHTIGDDALIRVGALLKNTLRTEDVFCRYGGEEFAFCMAVQDSSEIEQIGKRLVKAVKEIALHHDGEIVHFTASLGIASTSTPRKCQLSTLMQRADKAMYRAKTSGKDRHIIDDTLLTS